MQQFKVLFILGMVSPLMGKIDCCSALFPFYYFIYKKNSFKEDIIKILIALLPYGWRGCCGWIMVQKQFKNKIQY